MRANVLRPLADELFEADVVLGEERARRSSKSGRLPAMAVMKRLAASRARRACSPSGSCFRASSTSLRSAAEIPFGCCSSHSQ